ncbi:MAG: LacI family DNA-binding transcriptional regulator, partial [Rhodospirillaceae bacterium]
MAERAGCSVSTVSRALNGTGRIGEEMRSRVRDAAEALSFSFDAIGRSLQSQKSFTIGALIPTLSNPVFAEAIDGLQSICQQEHYQLLVACSRYEPDEEAKAVATLLAHRIDGLILTVSNAQDSPAITTALKAGVPFVLIFNHPDRALPAVAFNNHAAAQEVAQAMLDLGHRDVGFVAGRFRGSDRSKQRYAGFRQRYLAAGAPSPALLEVGYETASYNVSVVLGFAQ